MKMNSLFELHHWEGGERIHKPVTIEPGSRLFWVVGQEGKHHIPISCYVFADDQDDAVAKVIHSAEEFMKAAPESHDATRLARWWPEIRFSAQECRTDVIIQAGNCWAMNSGFCAETPD